MRLEDLFEKEVMPTVKTPSLEELAKMHNVSKAVLRKELEMGIKHEKEHSTKHKTASEIARDHLKEDPKYYTNLEEH